MVFITPLGKYNYLRAPMGLAQLSDQFNSFTAALVNVIGGINRSMKELFENTNSLEKLEDPLDKFLTKCKELRVKISMKKIKMGIHSHQLRWKSQRGSQSREVGEDTKFLSIKLKRTCQQFHQPCNDPEQLV